MNSKEGQASIAWSFLFAFSETEVENVGVETVAVDGSGVETISVENQSTEICGRAPTTCLTCQQKSHGY